MIVVAGILMVTVSVFGGFLLEGGPYADRDSLLRNNPLDPTNRRVSVIMKRRPQAGTPAAAPAAAGTPPATDGAERLRQILGAATSGPAGSARPYEGGTQRDGFDRRRRARQRSSRERRGTSAPEACGRARSRGAAAPPQARHLGARGRAGEKLQALGQLISGVTHELANPLTAVVACASFVSTATSLEDARRHAATIEEQGQRATKIVQTLSSFARRRAATRCAVSLNHVARTVVDLHGHQLAASDIELVQELEPDLPPVEGDPYELEQVVLNLVMNAHYAIVHARGRGRLVIRTRSTDDIVWLQVEDDGPGIPSAQIPQVFEAFYTTKGENGTGLGLAIARDIMMNHHGRIWAESDEGRGTAMTVELPRLRSGGLSAPPEAGLDDVALVPHGTILIVDDEPEFGHLLSELLRRRGYETEYVESAAAALGRVHEREFDIILTDLRMPKMSGEDLWNTLRRERPALAKRTVFMTGYYAARERPPSSTPSNSPASPSRSAPRSSTSSSRTSKSPSSSRTIQSGTTVVAGGPRPPLARRPIATPRCANFERRARAGERGIRGDAPRAGAEGVVTPTSRGRRAAARRPRRSR